jgi:hypothetical protein
MDGIDLTDNKALQDLKETAVTQAMSTKQVADIEKAVSVIKAITDRTKTEIDNRNAPRTMRWEGWKVFATAVVPVLTLATLVFTVYTQNEQLRVAQETNADMAWRETTKNVLAQISPVEGKGKQPPSVDARLAVNLLTPYVADPKHGEEALDLALLLLIRSRDPDVLRDFLESPELTVTSRNVAGVIGKMREIRSEFNFFDRMAQSKTTSPGAPGTPAPEAAGYENLLNYMTILGNKVAGVLRDRDAKVLPLNLTRVFFYQCDLSHTNLDRARLDESRFENVNLTDASITNPQGDIESSEWVASNWWDAKSVDGKLLKYTMRDYYPYPGPGVVYLNEPPDRSEYTRKVKQLCQVAGIACADAEIKYGTKPKSDGNQK